LANREKDIAEEILQAEGLSASRLGLRFDRVVGRVLGDLRTYVDGAAPEGVAVVVTITAPIRLPAKTVEILRRRIGDLVASERPAGDPSVIVHENRVSLRRVKGPAAGRPSLVGFVHNPGVAPGRLLDLAERWLAP